MEWEIVDENKNGAFFFPPKGVSFPHLPTLPRIGILLGSIIIFKLILMSKVSLFTRYSTQSLFIRPYPIIQ